MYALCGLLAAGCTVEPSDYTGPTIRVELTSNDFETARDSSTMPSFELGPDATEYSIDIEIRTQAGGATIKGSHTDSDVASVATRLTLAGAELPSPAYQREDRVVDPSFTSAKPIVIPGSALAAC